MKERQAVQYIARDNTVFTVATECQAYERENLPKMLAGLAIAELTAAFAREDTELADLLEAAGDKIRRDRLAAGDRKRRRNGEAKAEGPAVNETMTREQDLELEGALAFRAGMPGVIPDDLSPADGQIWLAGWDKESLARAQTKVEAA